MPLMNYFRYRDATGMRAGDAVTFRDHEQPRDLTHAFEATIVEVGIGKSPNALKVKVTRIEDRGEQVKQLTHGLPPVPRVGMIRVITIDEVESWTQATNGSPLPSAVC